MAKAIQKITLNRSEDIPFDKLELSQRNVRNIKAGVSIEDLAEDIALRKLLQSLSVRPIVGENGEETGRFEVAAGTVHSNFWSNRSAWQRRNSFRAS